MLPSAKQMGVASPHWHARSWLWWSNMTYVPVSYTAWHDPLISRSKGPNLPSVPRLRFRGAPTVPHCTLRGPPSRDAKEQKVTFQLSVSSRPTPTKLRVGFILRKLGSKWGIALPTTKKRWGEFGVFVYNVKKEQGRVRLHESLKSAASGFERLTVCFCEHAVPAHIYLYPLAVCAGERWGWAERCSKYLSFP